MDSTRSMPDETDGTKCAGPQTSAAAQACADAHLRAAAHLRIVHRLLDELGDKADDHCLTLTYYLVRAGDLADARMVLHFASRAARVALAHESYYVAGRYFQAAAEAGGETLSLDQRASLYCEAGEAFKRWSDALVSSQCYRAAANLYGRSGNRAGRELALEALVDDASTDDSSSDDSFDDEVLASCVVATAGVMAVRHS